MIRLPNNQKGFALLTVALLSSILFAGALTYMDIVVGEKRMIARSADQLKVQAIAEAGIERAMWEYSYNNASFSSASGWVAGAANTSTRTLSATQLMVSGASAGSYQVSVENFSSGNPLIRSVGSLASLGKTISQTLMVELSQQSSIRNAITAKDAVTLSGNSFVDSYNASKGAYNAKTNCAANGHVETNSESNGKITLNGNSVIKGDAGTGSKGSVVVAVAARVTGKKYSGVANAVPDIVVPPTLQALPSSGARSITTNATLAGDYRYTTLTIGSNANLTISGNVNLYVSGTGTKSTTAIFTNSSLGKITISPGATLNLYVNGNINLSGKGFDNKNTQGPRALKIYGTPAATTIAMGSNNTVTSAVINAPSAALTVTSNCDIYGAITAKTVDLGNNGRLHFDESLKTDSATSSGYKLRWARKI